MPKRPHLLPATAVCERFGHLRDGRLVEAITLVNGDIAARILTYGATLQSLIAPDKEGALADIVLGHDDLAGYEDHRAFFGSTIGRYANRIAGGSFAIDGKTFVLSQNDGVNTLHGGAQGFDQELWTISAIGNGVDAHVTLNHVSADGSGGFPGEVHSNVTYSLDKTGSLTITLEATTDRPTVIAMTNHALFNLAGAGAHEGAMLHRLWIPANAYTPVDASCIPTGEVRPVDGTVFDFRQGCILADGVRNGRDSQIAIGRGYDHNFVLDKGETIEPGLAAILEDPSSRRRLEVLSTEPGLQLYTGNAYDGRNIGKTGCLYRMGDGIALEPQKFPDTPNQPAFGSVRLDPGQTYKHTIIYRLSTGKV